MSSGWSLDTTSRKSRRRVMIRIRSSSSHNEKQVDNEGDPMSTPYWSRIVPSGSSSSPAHRQRRPTAAAATATTTASSAAVVPPIPRVTTVLVVQVLVWCCFVFVSSTALAPTTTHTTLRLSLSPRRCRVVSLSSSTRTTTTRPVVGVPSSLAPLLLLHNLPRPDDTNEAVVLASTTTGTSTTTNLLAADPATTTSRRLQGNDFIQSIERKIDDLSGGWALSYADLSPDSDQTWGGRAFLATNLAYGVAGGVITFLLGDYTLGLLTELCALASYNYHYYQLLAHGQVRADSVRLALLVDYVCAGASIFTGTVYLWWTVPVAGVPTVAVALTLVSVVFLLASWNWEYGRPYMVLHGLWHLCSAAAGYMIADAYQQASSLSPSVVVVAAVTDAATTAAAVTGTLI